jgi:hypothetical protein
MKADNLHLVGTDVNLGRVLKKKRKRRKILSMNKRLSIVSLNSRGVRPTSKLVDKPQHIKTLLERASISLLQETHIKEQPSLAIQSLFRKQSDVHYSPSTGTSGGLSSTFPANTSKHLHSDQTFVASSFDGFISECIIINVYFPPQSKWQDFHG